MNSALQLELSEQVFDCPITLARALLQSHAIEHVHPTVGIANDALFLQRASDYVHSLPRGAEHHREELLTELKGFAPRAIMCQRLRRIVRNRPGVDRDGSASLRREGQGLEATDGACDGAKKIAS